MSLPRISLRLPGSYRLVRRAIDILPLTGRGLVAGLLCGLALKRWAFGELDLVLFVIGVAGLVLLGLAILLTCGAALFLSRKARSEERALLRLEAGYPVATGFRVPALDRLPLVQIRWQWLRPEGVEVTPRWRDRELVEEVTAAHRGRTSGIVRRMVVEDAFGLTRLAWRREDPMPTLTLPDVGALRRSAAVPSFAAAEGIHHPAGAPEGDRMEIRRYVPGDSTRHILWKTYARVRELNVRLPERSVDQARRMVAYLVAAEDDEAAAAVARVALEQGALGDHWTFGADGTEEPAVRLEDALVAIARSGSIDPETLTPGAGLSTFLGRVGGVGEAHCVIFAPARPGPWLDGTLAAARAFRGAVTFLLGTDGVDRGAVEPWWRRLLLEPPPREGVPAEALNTTLRTLVSSGVAARVVDRRSGRSYGEAHRRALGAA